MILNISNSCKVSLQCELLCDFLFEVNNFLQTEQQKGFSPVCKLEWFFNMFDDEYDFAHTKHL